MEPLGNGQKPPGSPPAHTRHHFCADARQFGDRTAFRHSTARSSHRGTPPGTATHGLRRARPREPATDHGYPDHPSPAGNCGKPRERREPHLGKPHPRTPELRNSGTPEGTETPEKSASLAASRAGDRHGTPPTEGPGTHPLRDRAHIRRGPEDLPPRDPGTCPPRSPRSPTHRTAARRGPRSRFRQPRQKAKEAVPARAAAPDRAPPAPEGGNDRGAGAFTPVEGVVPSARRSAAIPVGSGPVPVPVVAAGDITPAAPLLTGRRHPPVRRAPS